MESEHVVVGNSVERLVGGSFKGRGEIMQKPTFNRGKNTM